MRVVVVGALIFFFQRDRKRKDFLLVELGEIPHIYSTSKQGSGFSVTMRSIPPVTPFRCFEEAPRMVSSRIRSVLSILIAIAVTGCSGMRSLPYGSLGNQAATRLTHSLSRPPASTNLEFLLTD